MARIFAAMSENDRYIPGVPCWVDTTQPDPEAAVAFYGAVFGWDLLDTGGFSAWALPAYGDFLEQRTPGTRAN